MVAPAADLRSLAALIPDQSRMVLDPKSKDAASAATSEALSAAETAQVSLPACLQCPARTARTIGSTSRPVRLNHRGSYADGASQGDDITRESK